MNIKEALDWGKKQLGVFEYPFLESEVLLAVAVDRNRAFLKMFSSYELEDEELDLYRTYIKQRQDNVPVAYIVGKKEWGGFDLWITSDVLIPRDETEVLCHHIADTVKHPKRILDIGTGSGAIALFLKKKFPDAFVMGVDISKEALQVAKKNASREDLEVQFQESDLLFAVTEENWDIIVANLPYLPEKMTVSPDVQKEPKIALFSGKDGMDEIQRLALQLADGTCDWKELWLEFLPKQKSLIEQIFYSYKKVFHKSIDGDVFFVQIIH